MRSVQAESVDSYLAALPEDVRSALEKLRRIIKTAAPGSTEAKLARARDGELKGYDVSGATIHFMPDKPLPAALVTKLVKARIAENEKCARK